MVGSITLLSAVLSLLPPPTAPAATSQGNIPRGSIGWVEATALAARVQRDHGVVAEPVVGAHREHPLPLAIVPIDPTDPGGHVRAEVRTALAFWRMAEAARKAHIELQVTSGFRSHSEQVALFNLYQRGRGPLASRPGRSNHQSGHALDLETRSPAVRKWLARHAGDFGFLRTVPSERWHWEYWGP